MMEQANNVIAVIAVTFWKKNSLRSSLLPGEDDLTY